MKLIETEFCHLYLGAAEDVLPTLEKESVHLVVTDPPYGVEYKSGHRTHGRRAVMVEMVESYFNTAVERVLEAERVRRIWEAI